MTRICVIGNSHSGAVKLASEAVMPDFPGTKIDFFAMQGGVFTNLQRDGDDFVPAFPNERYRKIFQAVNDCDLFSIAGYDHIWAVGYRFGIGKLQQLLFKNDVLEWPERSDKPLISEDLFKNAVTGEVAEETTKIKALFGQDPRLVVTPGPQPSQKVMQRGPNFDRRLTHVDAIGRAELFQNLHSAAIRKQLTDGGYQVMLQPAATLETPLTTQQKYGLDARTFNNADKPVGDDRHMNAEYGAILLRHYLENFAGLGHTNS